MRLILGSRRERGAVAVVVAILTVVLMSFAALAIDLGAAYSDRQQLQNGADAGALAYADSCQSGACLDKAQQYAAANKLDGNAIGTLVSVSDGTVTVKATSTHTNWFGAIIGIPTTPISARASAEWGQPSGGDVLPLTFSWCEFWKATGGWDDGGVPVNTGSITIHMVENACTLPSHNALAGGFGWLDGQNCVATVAAGDWEDSKPGNTEPSACTGFNWTSLVHKTALIPIYDEVRGSGTNGQYLIKGLAAFTITDFCFGSSAKTITMPSNCVSNKLVVGRFTSYTDLEGGYAIDSNAAHFGVGTVRLSA